MNIYTIYCSPGQTIAAAELGAPIETQEFDGGELDSDWYYDIKTNWSFHIPTAEQMMGWLRTQGFMFSIAEQDTGVTYHLTRNDSVDKGHCSTLEKAILFAIDDALDILKYNRV